MNIPVTVIIPCYNQGYFLLEALESLKRCDSRLFEIIIIDDGSTDPDTLRILDDVRASGYQVVRQENKGLSGARNTGIRSATTAFLLFLDADNKVRPGFFTKGIEILSNDPTVSVVYGNGEYFGDQSGIRKQGPFNLQKQLLVNYIDACAMVRRSVFDRVGYFDEHMRSGWEDWEMWLRIAFAGDRFVYVDDVFFDYRVRNDSMSKAVFAYRERVNAIENYVYAKYPDKMGMHHVIDFLSDRFRRNPIGFLAKLIMRTYFPGRYDRMLKANKIRNGL